MSSRILTFRREDLQYPAPFRISGHVINSVPVVQLSLTEGDLTGRGEAAGVYYLNDTVDHIETVLNDHRDALQECPGRAELRRLLPPGGARNAMDCAMWELESLQAGLPVWKLVGLSSIAPLVTSFTLSADAPEVLAAAISRFPAPRAIKLKLDGDFATDAARVAAVRAASPSTWLGVDANQGYSADALDDLVAMLSDADVKLLEQPIRRGTEADLKGWKSPIPLAADESIQCLSELEELYTLFDVVNIKLDKCGGLTEGLMMAKRARELGCGVMVGNMGGSALATSPAFVLGQVCDLVDLDGPWFSQSQEVADTLYADGMLSMPASLWGAR